MIAIRDLHFAYRKTSLYDDFDLALDAPGVTGLFGRNGSGKSTLLKLLAGLLFPQRGQIRVGGFEPARRHPDFLAQVMLVPEEFHLPNLTLDRMAATQSPFFPQFSAEAFADYAREFEIPADRPFEGMSLGQKKKAVLAFALATLTPLLLLDEPTNGLDVLAREQFKRIVLRPEQQARRILISTHQAHDLESILTHLLFLDGAKLALSAPRATLAQALVMGVAEDSAELSAVPAVIYHEPLGTHHAYVAARQDEGTGPVQLELLYKALSRNQAGVLDALAARAEAAHV